MDGKIQITMKKIIFLLTISIFLLSCKKDDAVIPIKIDLTKNIVGTYSGIREIVGSSQSILTVTIKKIDNSTVSLNNYSTLMFPITINLKEKLGIILMYVPLQKYNYSTNDSITIIGNINVFKEDSLASGVCDTVKHTMLLRLLGSTNSVKYKENFNMIKQ
jgi:hypothetical protein